MSDIHKPSTKRITSQQQAVFQSILSSHRHLTADQVYQEVRKSQPRISLATVHRNLDKLAESGFIGKVIIRGLKYFEIETQQHYHVICLSCGEVGNINSEPATDIEEFFSRSTPYALTGHDLILYGVCPSCQKRRWTHAKLSPLNTKGKFIVIR